MQTTTHGQLEIAGKIAFDQVWEDFSVGLGFKLVTFCNKPLFEAQVVFNDPVVGHEEAPAAIAVRMRIVFAGLSVCGPSCMTDAAFHRAVLWIRGFDFFFERTDPSDGSNDVGLAFVHDRHAARIVSAILKAFEAID